MRRNRLRKREFEKAFRNAIDKTIESKGLDLMDATKSDTNQVPLEFDRKIRRFIRNRIEIKTPDNQMNKTFQLFSKVSAYILIILILCILIVPNVAIARNFVTRLVIDRDKEYASFYLETQKDTSNNDTTNSGVLPTSLYYPSYLPDGMQLLDLHFNGSVVSYYFQDVSKDSIKIEVFGSGSVVNFDQKNLEKKEIIDIKGTQVYFYTKNDVNSFIWTYKKNIFTLITTLPKKESVNIIDGILKVK